MPFQVTFSQKAIPVGVIQSISAGEDGLTVCDPGYTLEATVIGDLNGHTVLWEQTEGSSVTFSGPLDTLIVSYTQTNYDNKTFRFYVDKGLASEKFDDVVVFGSPTDKNYTMLNASPYVFNTTSDVNGDSMLLRMISPFPFVSHDGVAEVGSYTTGYLIWNVPVSTGIVIDYTIQTRNTSGTWTDVITLPSTVRSHTVSTLMLGYRVVARTLFPNSNIKNITSNVFWLNGQHKEGISIADVASPSLSSISRPTSYDYVVEKLTISVKPIGPDSHYATIDIAANSVSSNYHVEQLSLTDKILPEYSSVTGAISYAHDATVANYDVTVLIGGQVGGS